MYVIRKHILGDYGCIAIMEALEKMSKKNHWQ